MAAIVKVQKLAPLVSDEGFYGKGAKRKIPGEAELSEHLARKAKALLALKESMIEKLEEHEQYHLLMELELPLSIILAEMEWQGVKVDVERLKSMGQELLTRLTID